MKVTKSNPLAVPLYNAHLQFLLFNKILIMLGNVNYLLNYGTLNVWTKCLNILVKLFCTKGIIV